MLIRFIKNGRQEIGNIPKPPEKSDLGLSESSRDSTIANGSILEIWIDLQSSNPRLWPSRNSDFSSGLGITLRSNDFTMHEQPTVLTSRSLPWFFRSCWFTEFKLLTAIQGRSCLGGEDHPFQYLFDVHVFDRIVRDLLLDPLLHQRQ